MAKNDPADSPEAREARVIIGFQGTHGAFSEQAIFASLAGPPETRGFTTFDGAVEAVATGAISSALLPVENTLAGTVHASFDAIHDARLGIFGEVVMPIRHVVMGVPGATLEGVRAVRSHPVALAQCTRFFRERPGVEAVVAFDTAGAAEEVAAGGDPSIAAIAPLPSASRYGLEVLAEGVQDREDNQTRFLLVAPEQEAMSTRSLIALRPGPRRAILSAEVPHRPGGLAAFLTRFADFGHDLSRIEGRPTGTPWSYRFLLEATLEGPLHSCIEALEAEDLGRVETLGAFLRFETDGSPLEG